MWWQASHLWRSIGKGVLFKTFDVKVQVHSVPELWRQTFWKVLLFLWNVTFIYVLLCQALFISHYIWLFFRSRVFNKSVTHDILRFFHKEINFVNISELSNNFIDLSDKYKFFAERWHRNSFPEVFFKLAVLLSMTQIWLKYHPWRC